MFSRCYLFSAGSVQVLHFTQANPRILVTTHTVIMASPPPSLPFSAVLHTFLWASDFFNALWNLSFQFCVKGHPHRLCLSPTSLVFTF